MTGKQRAFVDAYLTNGFNATLAAQMAGYAGEYFTLAQVGYENLKKPEIAAAIQERLNEAQMTKAEVLALIRDHAKATLDDFLDADGHIDIEQARQRGKLHLLKSITFTTATRGKTVTEKVRLELHDAQAALRDLGKHHQLFNETRLNLNKDVSQLSDEELEQELKRYGPK